MARGYWLVKSEPYKYSWEDLVRDGRTWWDGVRNHEARNNLAAMKRGDLAFYYHSNEGKEVVGIAEVVAESYPDPTAENPRWLVVDLAPHTPFAEPVSLATIKSDPQLGDIALVRRGRLSVVPIRAREFRRIAQLGKTRVPPATKGPATKNPSDEPGPAGKKAAGKKAASRT